MKWSAGRGIIEALRNKKTVLEPEKYSYRGNNSSNPGSEDPSDNEEEVPRPGFEPGSPARKAGMLGRTTPPGQFFRLSTI